MNRNYRRQPTRRDFFYKLGNDRQYQKRVFWLSLALLTFILPAMTSGWLVLIDVFGGQDGLVRLGNGTTVAFDFNPMIEDLVWRVTITGILFCIGWGMVLILSHGYSDLESVLVGISLLMVLSAVAVAVVITKGCFDDMAYNTRKYLTGVACIVTITILAYVVSAGVGKKVGWLSLFFMPVLVYQTVCWLPYLFMHYQPARILDGVVKVAGLMVTVISMAVVLRVFGGWPRRGDPG